ncbi:MAG: GNAT family N-acetyltransferase [Syntrophales bacterium]|nr:GNAT family N-acetyltransferase [Syntrophales bacterium]
MDSHIEIRTMTSADIPFGMMLKENAGWNQRPADWARLIALEPNGCFIARCDGRDVGTVTTTGYEKRFAWVGMFLVHPEIRRMGIGTRLLMHGIEYLEKKGITAVRLDATATGKPLYKKIGFVEEYLLERRQGIGESTGFLPDLQISPDAIDDLCAYDAPVFGADRSRVLRHLAVESVVHPGVAFDSSGEIRGYIMVRRGSNRHYIGPWVADHADVARCLWRWALSRIPGEPFFVDVCLANPDVDSVVPKGLFPVQRQIFRMVSGENRYPGCPQRVFGIAGTELG